jgi:hypothetical protein
MVVVCTLFFNVQHAMPPPARHKDHLTSTANAFNRRHIQLGQLRVVVHKPFSVTALVPLSNRKTV